MATQKTSRPAYSAAELTVRIHEAAYYHWQARGGPDGTALEDWLYAERLMLDTASEIAAEGVGPGAESVTESASLHAVKKLKASSVPRAVLATASVKKASKVGTAGAKVGQVAVSEKPKRKTIPKVKKSSAT